MIQIILNIVYDRIRPLRRKCLGSGSTERDAVPLNPAVERIAIPCRVLQRDCVQYGVVCGVRSRVASAGAQDIGNRVLQRSGPVRGKRLVAGRIRRNGIPLRPVDEVISQLGRRKDRNRTVLFNIGSGITWVVRASIQHICD
ncbi:hypothetical protein SDC9_181362 [bioreactor metagenome]|uniref:Uncharacterized protein n=1 Tax=bioreactor metagenome TaxID=1076179 RepID=A0A645H594_9ZZZZ